MHILVIGAAGLCELTLGQFLERCIIARRQVGQPAFPIFLRKAVKPANRQIRSGIAGIGFQSLQVVFDRHECLGELV